MQRYNFYVMIQRYNVGINTLKAMQRKSASIIDNSYLFHEFIVSKSLAKDLDYSI